MNPLNHPFGAGTDGGPGKGFDLAVGLHGADDRTARHPREGYFGAGRTAGGEYKRRDERQREMEPVRAQTDIVALNCSLQASAGAVIEEQLPFGALQLESQPLVRRAGVPPGVLAEINEGERVPAGARVEGGVRVAAA